MNHFNKFYSLVEAQCLMKYLENFFDDKDVLWLYVAMEDAITMHVVHCCKPQYCTSVHKISNYSSRFSQAYFYGDKNKQYRPSNL